MTAPRLAAAEPAGSQGFILVTVLWILAALAACVTVYALYVGNTVSAMAARDDAFAGRSLAIAAVELAAFRLAALPAAQRPAYGDIAFQRGRARVSAVFRTEAARIDLNTAPPGLLAGLFVALGSPTDAARQYAQRILGWRAPPPLDAAPGAEASLYQDAGVGYPPRAAPFVHAEELWRVVGLPPALVEAALPHVTVFSGQAAVDLAAADPLVRAAVAEDPDPPDTKDTAPSVSVKAAVPPEAVRVSVRVDFDGGRSRYLEAVILVRDFGDDPYRMLAWREDAGPIAAAWGEGRP